MKENIYMKAEEQVSRSEDLREIMTREIEWWVEIWGEGRRGMGRVRWLDEKNG